MKTLNTFAHFRIKTTTIALIIFKWHLQAEVRSLFWSQKEIWTNIGYIITLAMHWSAWLYPWFLLPISCWLNHCQSTSLREPTRVCQQNHVRKCKEWTETKRWTRPDIYITLHNSQTITRIDWTQRARTIRLTRPASYQLLHFTENITTRCEKTSLH